MTNKEKRKAREHAYLMMYQWDLSKIQPEEVVSNYWEDKREGKEIIEKANSLFLNAVKSLENVDAEISKHLKKGWFVSRLLPMDRSILRIAAYELLNGSFSPPAAIINDAVDLAKVYGEDEKSPAFINAVLDKINRSRKGAENSE